MATRTKTSKQKRKRLLPDQTKSGFENLRVRKGASEREVYAAVRRCFSAADLQKYTEIEEGVPMRQVLAELEEIHRRTKPRKSKSQRK